MHRCIRGDPSDGIHRPTPPRHNIHTYAAPPARDHPRRRGRDAPRRRPRRQLPHGAHLHPHGPSSWVAHLVCWSRDSQFPGGPICNGSVGRQSAPDLRHGRQLRRQPRPRLPRQPPDPRPQGGDGLRQRLCHRPRRAGQHAEAPRPPRSPRHPRLGRRVHRPLPHHQLPPRLANRD